jgi:uncharacterized protein (TIGR02246 family)
MGDDEKKIRELIETWMRATKDRDTETVLGLMTEDAKFLVAGRPPFGKEDFRKGAEQHADSGVQFDGQSELLELNVIGTWAYAVTHLSVTTTRDGTKVESRSGNTLTILKKENGKWLLARDANLLVPDPK